MGRGRIFEDGVPPEIPLYWSMYSIYDLLARDFTDGCTEIVDMKEKFS